MKPSSSVFKRYILIGYTVFVCIASAIYYLLAPILFPKYSEFNSLQYVFVSIWFIISSSIFLFIIINYFNKKLVKETDFTNEIIHRYEALSNATNDSIWDHDLTSEKTFYNERLLNTFGYRREELKDNTQWWENNIHPEDKSRVVERMNTTLESNKTNWEDEYRFRCKNGEYKIVYDRSFIVRDENNKPLRLIGAMKDVTKLRSLEKQFVEKQLQTKNEMGKTIILSHEMERKRIKDLLQEDVNQILASIKFFLTKLKEEAPSEMMTNTIRHLNEAMVKIMGISNKLSSSTFEFFGLKEAIAELIDSPKLYLTPKITLETDTFEEENCNKDVSLLLFRILEEKIFLISQKINTDNINIHLSNQSGKTELIISFQTPDKDIYNILDQSTLKDIRSKLDMFGGKIKINDLQNQIYSVDVLI